MDGDRGVINHSFYAFYRTVWR